VAAGFVLTDIVEPEWPEENRQVWGQWSPLRGRVFPGTSIFCGNEAGLIWFLRHETGRTPSGGAG